MSTAAFDLIEELKALDIRLKPDGDHLRFNAPRGTLTPELTERIRSLRSSLLEILHTPHKICTAKDRPNRPTCTDHPCRICSGTRFWRHAHHGHWLCMRCHPPTGPEIVGEECEVEADSTSPPDWGTDVEPLVNWFLGEGQHLIPDEPFRLTPWIEITNSERFRESILFDIACGPDGPRNRYGAVEADLRRLHHYLTRDIER